GCLGTVRDLEQSNTDLDEEISALKRRQSAIVCSGVNDVHELEIKELRELIDHVRGEKMSMQMEQKRLNNDIKKLSEEYGQEIRLHNEADELIQMFSKNTEATSLVLMKMKRMQAMLDEITLFKKNHEEEVDKLLAQIESCSVSVEKGDHGADIAAALREIRGKFRVKGHIEGAEERFQSKFMEFIAAVERNEEALRATKQEISKHRHQMRSTELDVLLRSSESFERQQSDKEDRHQINLQVQQLAVRLLSPITNDDVPMLSHVKTYQNAMTWLNTKMALNVEIIAYRQLLDGEESHYSSRLPRIPVASIATNTPKAEPEAFEANPQDKADVTKQQQAKTEDMPEPQAGDDIEETPAEETTAGDDEPVIEESCNKNILEPEQGSGEDHENKTKRKQKKKTKVEHEAVVDELRKVETDNQIRGEEAKMITEGAKDGTHLEAKPPDVEEAPEEQKETVAQSHQMLQLMPIVAQLKGKLVMKSADPPLQKISKEDANQDELKTEIAKPAVADVEPIKTETTLEQEPKITDAEKRTKSTLISDEDSILSKKRVKTQEFAIPKRDIKTTKERTE
uniref:IF rod domain-containing protein n=1 Tax=Petromyzon marinus TaxID=7757 RepID=S4RV04_PETMA